MDTRKKYTIAFVLGAIVVSPIAIYLGYKYYNASWIPEFLITFSSVLVGGIISALISYFAVERQVVRDKESREKTEKETANFYINLIYIELVTNLTCLENMLKVINITSSPNKEFWELLSSLSDEFIFDSHNALMQMGFQKHLPVKIESAIYFNYLNLRCTVNLIKTEAAFFKYYENTRRLDDRMKVVKKYIEEMTPLINSALEELEKYHPNLHKFRKYFESSKIIMV